jgi:site-specific DNA recombinase
MKTEPTNGQPLRALAYYRMSTDRQEASIPAQRDWARQTARREGLALLAEFDDPGVVGSEIDHRPGLQALLAHCDERFAADDPYDVLLCWDSDRLSRASSIRTAAVIGRLLDGGVSRMLTNEGWVDWTDDTDLTLHNVKQDLSKAAYSKSISKNVARGMRAKALRGEWTGGNRPPYAYIVAAGKLSPGDPVRVAVVQKIFRLYADTCMSLADIADLLESEGAPRRGPKPWTRYTIREILSNRRYLGDAVYGEEHKGKYHRACRAGVGPAVNATRREARKRARGLRNLPVVPNRPEDVIVVENAHPALIDRDTFRRVQEKFARMKTRDGHHNRHTTPKKGGGDWVFSGMLVCDGCGQRMWGVDKSTTRNGKKFVYKRYVCSTSRRYRVARGRCRTRSVAQDVIRDDVVRLLQKELLNPKALASLRQTAARLSGEAAEDVVRQRRGLKARAAELDKQIATATARIGVVPDDLLADLLAQIKKWKDERSGLGQELDNLRLAEGAGNTVAGDMAEALKLVEELEDVAREATPQELRQALAGLLETVTVHFRVGEGRDVYDRVEITLAPAFVKLLGRAGRACGRTRGI